MKTIGLSIPTLRTNGMNTYGIFEIPELRSLRSITLDGTFKWFTRNINIEEGNTPWQIFRNNPCIWMGVDKVPSRQLIIPNSSSRYVAKPRELFYRDVKHDVCWFIDISSGLIYDSINEEPVAYDIEEFWFRQVIEKMLWDHYSNSTSLPTIPILREYAEFYTDTEDHVIRPITEKDIPIARALFREVMLAEDPEDEFHLHRQWVERTAKALTRQYEQLWVCVDNRDIPIGLIGIEYNELKYFVVSLKHRRKGIGTALIQTAEKYCEKAGMFDMRIMTSALHSHAIDLYENMGYQCYRTVDDGERPIHYSYRKIFK